MKHKIGLAMALLVLFSSVAHADIPDYSSMSDKELIAAFYLLQSEAESRGLELPANNTPSTTTTVFEEMKLREGKYIIGQTIPAGSYTIICDKTEGEEMSDMMDTYGSLFGMFGEEGQDYNALFSDYGSLMNQIDEGMKVSILGEYGAEIESFYLKKGDTRAVTLNEGTALEIEDGSCTITAR